MYFYPDAKLRKMSTFLSVRFVVNLPEEPGASKFVQAVRVKTCLTEGEPCGAHTCRGISTVCRYGREGI